MRGEADLVWFLSFGETLFERSTTGATLELLESRAYASHPCTRRGCKGGILEKVAPGVKYQVGDWCPRCKGTGVVPVRLTATSSSRGNINVRPTTSAGRAGRSGIDDDRLPRYASVSRRMWLMPVRLRDALRLGYGDSGEACSNTRLGRSWAVAPLTAAGSRLLSEYVATHPEHGGQQDPLDTLTAMRQADQAKQVSKRNPLVWQAVQQAETMLAEAEDAWDALFGERDPEWSHDAD